MELSRANSDNAWLERGRKELDRCHMMLAAGLLRTGGDRNEAARLLSRAWSSDDAGLRREVEEELEKMGIDAVSFLGAAGVRSST